MALQDMEGADLFAQADTGELTPLLQGSLCEPGRRRCLGEQSPLSDVCGSEGLSWTPDPCPDQFICQDQQCVPFTCVPERPICLGTNAQAVCADDGRSVREVKDCLSPLTCQSGQCIDLCEDAAQRGSYTGCEYIANQLYNLSMRDESNDAQSPFAIIAANPHPLLPTTISLTDTLGNSIPRITPRTLRPASTYTFGEATRVQSEILRTDGSRDQIEADAKQITLEPGEAAALLLDSGTSGPYHLSSTQPIVAYQFNPYCCNFTASNDASLLLPTSSLGLIYRIVNYPTMYITGELPLTPYISIVASEDNTIVEVEATTPVRQAILLNGDSIAEPLTTSASHRFMLNRGQIRVLEISNSLANYRADAADLSGTLISSNKPLAVFSGHPCTFVPQDAWACDHLEEQMFPAETLGKLYILPSLTPRNTSAFRDPATSREGIYWRVVAHEDATIVTDPPLTELTTYESSSFATKNCLEFVEQGSIVLKAGQVCELGLNDTLAMESDAPLIIAGVISGHQSTGLETYGTQAGDPAMFLLPPVRQFRRQYSFVTSPTFKKTYAVISAPRDTQFSYRSGVLSEDRVSARAQTTFAGQPWDVFSIRIDSGFHELEADAPFGLVVYAYDDYVSYAFPGGLNLTRNSKGL